MTVEWDTHKTVLVDVPGATPGGVSPDVEMEGLGLNRRERDRDDREGYGRLEDDRDDDYVVSPSLSLSRPSPSPFAASRCDQARSPWMNSMKKGESLIKCSVLQLIL